MKLPTCIRAVIAMTGIVLAACAGGPTTEDDVFNRLAVQTDSEIRRAENTGFLWRDTEQVLADARKASREGRHNDAMELAQKALRQAQLAQQQAKDSANAVPSYPAVSNPQ